MLYNSSVSQRNVFRNETGVGRPGIANCFGENLLLAAFSSPHFCVFVPGALSLLLCPGRIQQHLLTRKAFPHSRWGRDDGRPCNTQYCTERPVFIWQNYNEQRTQGMILGSIRVNSKETCSYKNYRAKFFPGVPDGAPRALTTNGGLGGSGWTCGEISSLKSEQVAQRGCGIHHKSRFREAKPWLTCCSLGRGSAVCGRLD